MDFQLPCERLRFTGLSECQAKTLRETWRDFVVDCDPSLRSECRAERLARPLGLQHVDLEYCGQYAPRKDHRPDTSGFQLTGMDFQARVPEDLEQTPAQLAVWQESELASPGVMENFLRVFTAHRALRHSGVILHSAGLVFDGRAYIFCGHSGAGKTTLSRKAHAAGARVLSDDINLLLPARNGFEAHAVPFTGEFGRTLVHTAPRPYPVAALVLLQQSAQLRAAPINQAAAVAALMAGSPFVNDDETQTAPLFDVLIGLTGRVPVLRLENRRDDGIREIMSTIAAQLSNPQAICA